MCGGHPRPTVGEIVGETLWLGLARFYQLRVMEAEMGWQ